MIIERLLVAFSIATVVFALSYAGSAAISVKKEPAAAAIARPLDAKALLKKLEMLDTRLREAQASIDQVMVKLASVREESERDATRVRLDVLYRLESGLAADIERTRGALARVSAR
ncbi:MAG: hypothetical protein M4D80_12695 [Myxococcota bacterium]|nr:hypothetical protein [Myxococcota bacterium]